MPSGGLKCPVCSFVNGTKWEFNRHLKNKHGLKLVENEGDPKWEVTFWIWYWSWHFQVQMTDQVGPGPGHRQWFPRGLGFLVRKLGSLFKAYLLSEGWDQDHACQFLPWVKLRMSVLVSPALSLLWFPSPEFQLLPLREGCQAVSMLWVLARQTRRGSIFWF